MAVADPRFRSGPPASPRVSPPPLPDTVAAATSATTWTQVWVKPGSEVWRAAAPSGPTRYLKVGAAGGVDGLDAEADRLRWLPGRTPLAVPTVVAHATADDVGVLLIEAVAGVPAHDPDLVLGGPDELVRSLGRGLRRFHDGLGPAGCPFTATAGELVSLAERRVAAGADDPSTMAATYRRHSAPALVDHARRSRPIDLAEDLVVAHGDPCQPNLLVDPATGEMASVVDLGRLGVSDRYRDLAIAARSLTDNLGPELVWRFFEAYGLDHPDPSRLEWYVLLDELW